MIKVLLAEDTTSVSYVISNILETLANFQVVTVSNGEQAVKAVLQDDDNEIDIVLMDIRMPVVDGIEAIGLLKELRPALPIIAVTAYGDKKTREAARAAGVDDFFVKATTREKYNRLAIKIKRLATPSRVDETQKNTLMALTRRLNKLKERQAQLGLETPVSVLTEIEDLERQIEEL